jgi:hypothetical protein
LQYTLIHYDWDHGAQIEIIPNDQQHTLHHNHHREGVMAASLQNRRNSLPDLLPSRITNHTSLRYEGQGQVIAGYSMIIGYALHHELVPLAYACMAVFRI